MRGRWTWAAAVAALAAMAVPAIGVPGVGADPPEEARGRYEVVGDSASYRRGVVVRHELGFGFSAELTPGEAARLRREGARVQSVVTRSIEQSRSDSAPQAKRGATRPIPSDTVPYGVELMQGAAVGSNVRPATSAGAGVTVAVLDTGVNGAHPDLARRVASCADMVSGKTGCSDQNGHGTHVAGTIAADGGADGLGIWGVAPGAAIRSYRVCGAVCYSDDIAAAIRAATAAGVDVISMSLGGNFGSELEHLAIKDADAAGVLVVAAAGNDGPSIGTIDYPGAFAEVVAVGAIGSSLAVASFSSRGVNDGDGDVREEREVAHAAPGSSVLSTYKSGYGTLSGTSMATPHVSGFAAVLLAGGATDARAALEAASVDVVSGASAAVGDDPASGLGFPHA